MTTWILFLKKVGNSPAETTRTETDLGGCDVYTGLYPIVVVLAVAEVVE